MMQPEGTVFVIDDDAAVRHSLRWLIESANHRVESFASARDFLERSRIRGPGCIVTDVRMPGMSGLELQEVLAGRGMPLPLIVITGHGDVGMAVRAMKAGAFDFVEKPFKDEALLSVVEAALAQSRRTFDERVFRAEMQALLRRLTPREREVLDMIVAGASNKDVAGRLGISEKTVEAHRAHIMEKMEARTFADLLRRVLAVGTPLSAGPET